MATAADGSYRLEAVEPGRRLKIKAAKATRKQYRLDPKRVVAVADGTDTTLPDIVATPR